MFTPGELGPCVSRKSRVTGITPHQPDRRHQGGAREPTSRRSVSAGISCHPAVARPGQGRLSWCLACSVVTGCRCLCCELTSAGHCEQRLSSLLSPRCQSQHCPVATSGPAPGPNHTESQALDSFPAAPLRIRLVFSGTDIEVELRWTAP